MIGAGTEPYRGDILAATAAATAVDTDLTDASFSNTSSIIFEATYEV